MVPFTVYKPLLLILIYLITITVCFNKIWSSSGRTNYKNKKNKKKTCYKWIKVCVGWIDIMILCGSIALRYIVIKQSELLQSYKICFDICQATLHVSVQQTLEEFSCVTAIRHVIFIRIDIFYVLVISLYFYNSIGLKIIIFGRNMSSY
jgi:hypothetical protein